jgi:hypothetical protein
MIRRWRARSRAWFLASILMCSVAFVPSLALADDGPPKSVEVAPGVVLHYEETGEGPPLLLVHGSASDYRIWQQQVEGLSRQFRVISCSRRYNVPNQNAPVDGYSAKVDAEPPRGRREVRPLELICAPQATVGCMCCGDAEFGVGELGGPPEIVITFDDGSRHHFRAAVWETVEMWKGVLAGVE